MEDPEEHTSSCFVHLCVFSNMKNSENVEKIYNGKNLYTKEIPVVSKLFQIYCIE
jgi:hypothetical protein